MILQCRIFEKAYSFCNIYIYPVKEKFKKKNVFYLSTSIKCSTGLLCDNFCIKTVKEKLINSFNVIKYVKGGKISKVI